MALTITIMVILLLIALVVGILTYYNGNIAGYFIVGVILIIVGASLFMNGLLIENGLDHFVYDAQGKLQSFDYKYDTLTKETDVFVALGAWGFAFIGICIMLWGIVSPFEYFGGIRWV